MRRALPVTVVIAALSLAFAPSAGAEEPEPPPTTEIVAEVTANSLAAARVVAVSPLGVATCGWVTCTFYWDAAATSQLQSIAGGAYSGTKSAIVAFVFGVACVPFSGPLAAACAALAGIGFTQVQESLNHAVTLSPPWGGCLMVKFQRLFYGIWAPVLTWSADIWDPYCYRDL